MRVAPLAIAMAAGVLLVASVSADLAMDQSVALYAKVRASPEQLIGEGSLDGRQDRPLPPVESFVANRSDVVAFELRLDNGYPWTSSRSFDLRLEGCWEGSPLLARFDVRAPARGFGSAEAEASVAKLLGGSGVRIEPKPVATPDATLYAYPQVCLGERYVASAVIPFQEVTT